MRDKSASRADVHVRSTYKSPPDRCKVKNEAPEEVFTDFHWFICCVILIGLSRVSSIFIDLCFCPGFSAPRLLGSWWCPRLRFQGPGFGGSGLGWWGSDPYTMLHYYYTTLHYTLLYYTILGCRFRGPGRGSVLEDVLFESGCDSSVEEVPGISFVRTDGICQVALSVVTSHTS